jgi:hypothetical protein
VCRGQGGSERVGEARTDGGDINVLDSSKVAKRFGFELEDGVHDARGKK